MRQNGLELRQKGNGFVITGPDGLAVKASSVDRSLSRAALEKKLGSFESSVPDTKPSRPSRKRLNSDSVQLHTLSGPEIARLQCVKTDRLTLAMFPLCRLTVVNATRANRWVLRGKYLSSLRALPE